MKRTANYADLSPEDLGTIFDTGNRDHICALIAESHDPAPAGWRTEKANSVRRILIPAIDRLIAGLYAHGRGRHALEFEAATRFRDVSESVAEYLVGSERLGATMEETRAYSEQLRQAWLELAAEASAYRMYDDLPREAAAIERHSEQQRDRRKGRLKNPEATREEILAFLDRYEAENGKKQGRWKAAERRFGLSRVMLQKRIEE